MDPHFRNPVSQQFNIGYQWALNNRSVVEFEYVHELGLHEDKTININPHIATAFGVDVFGNPKITNDARPLAAALQLLESRRLAGAMDEQSVNRSRYDGLNITYRQQMYKHFSLNANYTLSRAMGWAIQSGGPDASFRFPKLSARSSQPVGSARLWTNAERRAAPRDLERHRGAPVGLPGLANPAIRFCTPNRSALRN